MTRKYCLILGFLLNAVQIYSFLSPIKTANSYDLLESGEPSPKPSLGYVEIATNLLNQFKSGNVNVDALNKFKTGVEQYFLFKLYEKDAIDVFANTPKGSDVLDPYVLNDFSDEIISFKDVKVYGFPAFKKGIKPEVTYDGLGSDSAYQFNFTTKSDVVIFTGTFTVHNANYFFVYNLKQSTYSTYTYSIRGLKKPSSVKLSLQFAKEEFIHTYDSSYQNYTYVNEIVTKNFTDLFLKVYFFDLTLKVTDKIKAISAEKDIEFTSLYKKFILLNLIDSALQYVKFKGLNSFEVKPINFTTSVGSRIFVQSYKDIKLDGLLNFVKYELVNSTIELFGENNTPAKLSDAIQLIYPVEGENQTFVSFLINDGYRENTKKFKVKTITITAIYDSTLTERPYKVSLNEVESLSGSGFLIEFEFDNLDPTFQFIISHISNEISRAIKNTLLNQAA